MYKIFEVKEAIKNTYEHSGNAGMFVGNVQVYGSEPLKGNVTVGKRPVCNLYVEETSLRVYFRDSGTHVGYKAHRFHDNDLISEIAKAAKTCGITEDIEAIFTEFIEDAKEESVH